MRPLHTSPGPTDTGTVDTKVGAVPATIVGGKHVPVEDVNLEEGAGGTEEDWEPLLSFLNFS